MRKMADYDFREINNAEVWDDFAKQIPSTTSKVPRTTFVQSYTWSKLQVEMGNEIIRLGIYESDSLVGIGLGTVVRAKRGSFLHFRHGPYLNFQNKTLVKELTSFLKQEAKKKGLWFVRLSPLVERGSSEEEVIHEIPNVQKIPINEVEGMDAWVMVLDYQNEDDLFNSIKKKTRYEIRKAMRECEVFVTQDPSYVEAFYEIEMDTVKRNNWRAFSKNFTQREFDLFNEKGDADIILIKYKDKFISGGIFIHFAGQTFYHYGASLTEFRNIPAGYLVLWEAIKIAFNKDHRAFNFWGIAPEGADKSHPWFGLTSFKKKFPGQEQLWMHAVDIPVSSKYWLTNLYERYERRRKGF